MALSPKELGSFNRWQLAIQQKRGKKQEPRSPHTQVREILHESELLSRSDGTGVYMDNGISYTVNRDELGGARDFELSIGSTIDDDPSRAILRYLSGGDPDRCMEVMKKIAPHLGVCAITSEAGLMFFLKTPKAKTPIPAFGVSLDNSKYLYLPNFPMPFQAPNTKGAWTIGTRPRIRTDFSKKPHYYETETASLSIAPNGKRVIVIPGVRFRTDDFTEVTWNLLGVFNEDEPSIEEIQETAGVTPYFRLEMETS